MPRLLLGEAYERIFRIFGEDDSYMRDLRRSWQDNLERAFRSLPELPKPAAMPRLVDE